MEASGDLEVQEQKHYTKEVTWSVDPETKNKIQTKVSKAAVFLNTSGINWYLVGGLGVELSNGVVTRDHPDIDVAVFRDELEKFYDYATHKGARFFRSLSREQLSQYKDKYGREPEIKYNDGVHFQAYIGGREELVDDSYSPFVAIGDQEIDLDIIDVGENGTIPLLGETGIVFNRTQYAEVKEVEIKGEKIRLGPNEISALHKIIQGKEKDRQDLMNLSEEDKDKIGEIIKKAGINFSSGGKVINDINDLLNVPAGNELNNKVWEVSNQN